MRIVNHGGRCCGIKHIINFPMYPNAEAAPDSGYYAYCICQAEPKHVVFHGASGEMKNPAENFWPGEAPQEDGEVRLKKLLRYVDSKKKEGHLIEVVLKHVVYLNWKEVLEKNHFVVVTEFNNCNTFGTKLVVLHRVLPIQKKTKKEKKTVDTSNIHPEDYEDLPY